jgi:hypothetical protein
MRQTFDDWNDIYEMIDGSVAIHLHHLGLLMSRSISNTDPLLDKAERPWRSIRDNAYAMMDSIAVPNSMWLFAVSTVVYFRNRTFSRVVGLSGGVPLTLLMSTTLDVSNFRAFRCTVFAEVPSKLRRKLGEKVLRGVMVGYSPDALGYRVYNLVTRHIATSVHVVFNEDVQGIGVSAAVNSMIIDASDVDGDHDHALQSHPLDLDTHANDDAPALHVAVRTLCLRLHPIRDGELVAHLSDPSRVFVTACCDSRQGKAKEDIVERPNVATLMNGPLHLSTCASADDVALMSAKDCFEPTSYRATLSSTQTPEWHSAMQHEYSSVISNGTWELTEPPAGRVVVNIMWIYKSKSDTKGEVTRYKARFVAKDSSQRAGLDYT